MQTATGATELLGLNTRQVWDTDSAFAHLQAQAEADTKRTAERRINSLGIWPALLQPEQLQDELQRPIKQLVLHHAMEQARKKRERILFVQLHPLPDGTPCLHANDARNARFWLPLSDTQTCTLAQALHQLQIHVGKTIAVFGHGELVKSLRNFEPKTTIQTWPQVYQSVLAESLPLQKKHPGNQHPTVTTP